MSFAEKLRATSPQPDLHVAGVPADRLRGAMGMFATGVTVITTRDPNGRPFGATARAVSSVSLRPPLVLACLREDSETLGALLARRTFAINVLHTSQTELSDRFARPSADDTWDGVAHRDVAGIPVLEGAITTLWCDLHDLADGGDHSVVVGHVTDLEQLGSTPDARAAARAGVPIGELLLPGCPDHLTLCKKKESRPCP